MAAANIDAQPAPIAVDTGRCALVIIDMQRDFLEPGGFGEPRWGTTSRSCSEIGGPLPRSC